MGETGRDAVLSIIRLRCVSDAGLQSHAERSHCWVNCGYQGETVRMLFSWLAMNGWLMDHGRSIRPTGPHMAASGLSRITIREMARARFQNVPGRRASNGRICQAAVPGSYPRAGLIEACLATALDEVTIFWLLGALSVQLNAGALHKIDLAGSTMLLTQAGPWL